LLGTALNIGGTEALRVDSSRRLLIGTSTSPTAGNGQSAKLVIQGYAPSTPIGGGYFSLQRGQAATGFGTNEQLGLINFGDNTGASFALIEGYSDGTPGASDFPGRLVFSTTPDGASSPTERLRITSTGQVRLAGAGITFNGDTAAANELDDYEEGTWTPSVGGTATYSDQNGTYTKIGRTVTINFSLNITLLGTGSNNTISGLPFYVGSAGYGATGYFSGLAINVIGLTCNVTGTTVLFNSINASGSTATNNPAILGNSCLIQGSATYFV
jgi:hypothetical protein